MAKFLQLLALWLAVCNAGASVFDAPKRDGLSVTWLKNSAMPLTIKDAQSQGFVPVDVAPNNANISCANGPFLGYRYMKPNESTLMLLYGVHGYVAGVQTSFPKRYVAPDDFAWFENTAMIIKDRVGGEDTYTLTSYLIDPKIICTVGRTQAEFDQAKSGTGLYIQHGANPLQNYVVAPLKQEDVTTPWTKGGCLPTMGWHYWYSTSRDMDCADFRPIFLLYNHKVLTGFGWAVQIMGLKSDRYEFPPKISLPLFFTVPNCINKSFDRNKGVTTMHVFLDSNIWNRNCY